MTDREMLELAARAAGYVVESHHVSGGAWVYPVGEVPDADGYYPGLFLWRPREDGVDALRLAVKLGFTVNIWNMARKTFAGDGESGIGWTEPHGANADAATRRAIVRAAAEIGRQMEQQT